MAELLPYPQETLNFFHTPPVQGETHRWLFKAALRLKNFVSEKGAFIFLREFCDKFVKHRKIPDREIETTVQNAYELSEDSFGISYPAKSETLVSEVIEKIPPLFDLQAKKVNISKVFSTLFLENEFICVGYDVYTAIVTSFKNITQYLNAQFIVPNPLKEITSKRGNTSIAKHRHVVVEIDDLSIPKNKQISILSFLAEKMPLILVVDSAGKSLHGWFKIENKNEAEKIKFFMLASLLGADVSRFAPAGWVRMPNGVRPTEGRNSGLQQNIVYFAE